MPPSYGGEIVQILVQESTVLTVVYLMDYVKDVKKVTGEIRVKNLVI